MTNKKYSAEEIIHKLCEALGVVSKPFFRWHKTVLDPTVNKAKRTRAWLGPEGALTLIAVFAAILSVVSWRETVKYNMRLQKESATQLLAKASDLLNSSYPTPGDELVPESAEVTERRLRADELLSRVMQIEPNSSIAHRDLGIYYAQIGEYNAALAEMKTAIVDLAKENLPKDVKERGHAEILSSTGWVYLQEKNYPASHATYKRAMELDPNLPQELYGIGSSLVGERNYWDALPDFEEALRHDPGDAETWYAVGRDFMHLKIYEAARLELEKATSLPNTESMTGGTPFVAYMRLGRVDTRLHDYLSAAQEFREALVVRPKNVWAMDSLARVLGADATEETKATRTSVAARERREADRLFSRAIAKSAVQTAFHVQYGEFLYGDGRCIDGLYQLRIANALQPGNAKVARDLEAASKCAVDEKRRLKMPHIHSSGV